MADASPESALEAGFQNAARRLYNRLPLGVVRLRNRMLGFDPNRRMSEALGRGFTEHHRLQLAKDGRERNRERRQQNGGGPGLLLHGGG
jgi:hypothetical protein